MPSLRDRFEQWCGRGPTVSSDAGGRVNLIGEHTDYHEGFVLPAAIDLRTTACAAPRPDGVLRIRSEAVRDEVQIDLGALAPRARTDWRSYVLGPSWALIGEGIALPGADILVDSQVPFGGGLSSSASVEVCLVALGARLAARELDPRTIARIARRAENEFCHVPCGAMDQMASACGREGHAILLDCRTMETRLVPMPADWAIVVADSGVRHSLAAGEYAKRQRECASGLGKLASRRPGIAAARDLTVDILASDGEALSEVERRRLRHVVAENERVWKAAAAMRGGELGAMGELLWASHRSLAADYEVSCAELDTLVEIAAGIPGIAGARLTGAGFGGNTLNLVRACDAQFAAAELADRYKAKTGRLSAVRVVIASRGVTVS